MHVYCSFSRDSDVVLNLVENISKGPEHASGIIEGIMG